MESEKFQDMQGEPASWRANGTVLLQVQKHKDQENLGLSSSLKTNRLKTQKELIFLSESKGRKELTFQFQGIQTGGILSYWEDSQPFHSSQVFSWLGEAHAHQESTQLYSAESPDLNVHLIHK